MRRYVGQVLSPPRACIDYMQRTVMNFHLNGKTWEFPAESSCQGGGRIWDEDVPVFFLEPVDWVTQVFEDEGIT